MKDMTQGKPLKLIIGFAVPMLIGNIFQQVYNVADTVIVGRFLGESALAGVGSTGTLTYFLLALVSGMCNGAGLVVAQCFGCGNKERLAKTVTALVWVAGMLTGIMSLIGIFGAEFFLRLLSVPENVMGYSAEYLHIIYTFVFGSVIYNGCAAILNSVGDSRTPLRAVIASSAVNIAFDLFFIIVCKMGVAGAAYATILAQCTSAVICFIKVWKTREEIGLSLMKWKPEAGSRLYPFGGKDWIPGGVSVLHDRFRRHECTETGEFLWLVHHGSLRGGKSCGQCGDSGYRLYRNGTFGIYRAEYCKESV
jgi:MATE efflux family protein dinF